jgi:DNA-binding CsgD family transcriptional regulator
MYSQARLLMMQGRIRQASEMMLASGRRFARHGGQNPAMLPWRSGAALMLLALGQRERAQSLMTEELELAREWGAAATLGRSLRVTGVVRGGDEGLELLHTAEAVLATSSARLEHAKALIDLGSALRRSGRRRDARQQLQSGVDLARLCGATPLVQHASAELRAAGALPRNSTPTGTAGLTPSERRVAELAAAGHSNREIALKLFITTNTVEVHLTRIYRKLGTSRLNLSKHLAPHATTDGQGTT